MWSNHRQKRRKGHEAVSIDEKVRTIIGGIVRDYDHVAPEVY
jgi:hypothetical protein